MRFQRAMYAPTGLRTYVTTRIVSRDDEDELWCSEVETQIRAGSPPFDSRERLDGPAAREP
jgi:hypothetical protein